MVDDVANTGKLCGFEVASPHRRDLLLADGFVGGDVVKPFGRGVEIESKP